MTEEEEAGLTRLLAHLACLVRGHEEPEGFMEEEHARFRCPRCKQILLPH